jgi:hypothetical protein
MVILVGWGQSCMYVIDHKHGDKNIHSAHNYYLDSFTLDYAEMSKNRGL